MHLADDKTPLPAPLRDSNLPWTADWDEQAAAPKDGDAWTALLGCLRFDLDVYWDSMSRDLDAPGKPPSSGKAPSFNLRLFNTATDKDLGFWEFPRLDIAVHVAQTLHQERLDEICTSIRKELLCNDVAA